MRPDTLGRRSRLILAAGLLLATAAAPAYAGDDPAALSGEPYLNRDGTVVLGVRFAPRLGDPYNHESGVGPTVSLWPVRWFGLDIGVDAWPLEGAANATARVPARLRLLDASYRLESVDPRATVTVGVALAPFHGYVAPPGAPPVQAEVFLGFGLAVTAFDVEMLAYDVADDGAVLGTQPEVGATAGPYLLLGGRLAFNRLVGVRWDVRLITTVDDVLDYDTEEAAAQNRNLGPLANRLTCHDLNVGAACKSSSEAAVALGVALEFSLGKHLAEGLR